MRSPYVSSAAYAASVCSSVRSPASAGRITKSDSVTIRPTLTNSRPTATWRRDGEKTCSGSVKWVTSL